MWASYQPTGLVRYRVMWSCQLELSFGLSCGSEWHFGSKITRHFLFGRGGWWRGDGESTDYLLSVFSKLRHVRGIRLLYIHLCILNVLDGHSTSSGRHHDLISPSWGQSLFRWRDRSPWHSLQPKTNKNICNCRCITSLSVTVINQASSWEPLWQCVLMDYLTSAGSRALQSPQLHSQGGEKDL